MFDFFPYEMSLEDVGKIMRLDDDIKKSLFEDGNYIVVLASYNDLAVVSLHTMVYAVINKTTDVVEFISTSLPSAITGARNLEIMLKACTAKPMPEGTVKQVQEDGQQLQVAGTA